MIPLSENTFGIRFSSPTNDEKSAGAGLRTRRVGQWCAVRTLRKNSKTKKTMNIEAGGQCPPDVFS